MKPAKASTLARPHIVVIDPGVKAPELDCYNLIAQMSDLPTTCHMPAIFGIDSLTAEDTAAKTSLIKGFVILGSASSVNERQPWQGELENWLMPKLQLGIPTLGICYGHQMLAYMFGGKVDYLYPDQTKLKGFREIDLLPTAAWGTDAGRIPITVTHNEGVTVLPECMTVVGRSPQVAVDGLAHRSLPIWGLQSHPETTNVFLKNSEIEIPESLDILGFGHEIVRRFLAYCSSRP